MKKILLLALLIGVSASVVWAGVNSAITNKDNLAQAQTKPGFERIPVKLKTIGENPCPPNMGVPGGQAVAHGGTYTPEELAKLEADAAVRRAAAQKTTVRPGGQAVAQGGTYTPEELAEFNRLNNPTKTENASPTPPCPKPTLPPKTNPLIRLIKQVFGTTPTRQPTLPQGQDGTTPKGELFPRTPNSVTLPPEDQGGAPDGVLLPPVGAIR